MRKGIVGVAILAAVVVGGFGLAIVSSTDEGDRAFAAELVQYDSCDALLGAIQDQALDQVGPYGFDEPITAFGRGGDVVTDDLGGTVAVPEATDEDAFAGAEAAPTTTAPSGDVGATSGATGGDGETPTELSGTNVQEEGIDEPDLVKTDGELLVTVTGTRLVVLDVAGDEPVELGRTELLTGSSNAGADHSADFELLLSGDSETALVLGQAYDDVLEHGDEDEIGTVAPDGPLGPEQTSLIEVDLTDPADPEVVHEAAVEGSYTSARMVGDVARVVTATYAPDLGFVYPSDGSEASMAVAEQTNRGLVRSSTIDRWLPQVVVDGGEPVDAVACDQVGIPEEASGFGTASVITVDLGEGLDVQPGAATAVLGGSEVVYASADNLYVATVELPPLDVLDELEQLPGIDEVDSVDDLDQLGELDGRPVREVVEEAVSTSTAVHRFALPADGTATYQASGEVPGRMLDQFSFSEHDGHLRVATTVDGLEASESRLTVLAVDDLVEVGSVGDIGRGEELYAVRLLGDVGYAVTFRQTDPLFTLDLADPADPRVVGELEIPGYSSYLHPMSDDLLIGVGQAGTDDGVLTGTQVSLFDVSDPSAPERIQQHEVAGGDSEAEYDHRAFLWWPDAQLAVLPVSIYGYHVADGDSFDGAIGLHVAAEGIEELGRIVNHDPDLDCEVPGVSGSAGAPTPEPTPATPTTVVEEPPFDEPVVEEPLALELEPEVPCTGETIRRSLVVGDRVLTVSDSVVATSDLETLAPVAATSIS